MIKAGVWRTIGGPLGAVLVLSLVLGACHAGSGSGHPGHPTAPPELASGIIPFYRGPLNHLNAVRYGSCPMHPTCSEYARQAVAAYGPIQGWIMAMDRLLRCGRDETGLAPVVYIEGQPKSYDPLPANGPWPPDP